MALTIDDKKAIIAIQIGVVDIVTILKSRKRPAVLGRLRGKTLAKRRKRCHIGRWLEILIP